MRHLLSKSVIYRVRRSLFRLRRRKQIASKPKPKPKPKAAAAPPPVPIAMTGVGGLSFGLEGLEDVFDSSQMSMLDQADNVVMTSGNG